MSSCSKLRRSQKSSLPYGGAERRRLGREIVDFAGRVRSACPNTPVATDAQAAWHDGAKRPGVALPQRSCLRGSRDIVRPRVSLRGLSRGCGTACCDKPTHPPACCVDVCPEPLAQGC